MGDIRPPERGRVLPSEYLHSARHGRAAGVATGRAKIAGETHPSVIGASQATARSPPYPDPKHITLYSQPVEGAIPNRWRANPEIKRPYGPDSTVIPLCQERGVGLPISEGLPRMPGRRTPRGRAAGKSLVSGLDAARMDLGS